MSDLIRDRLAEHAAALDPPMFDVEAMVRQGDKRVRNRRRGILAGGVLAVALAVGVPAVVVELSHEPRTIDQPKPPEEVVRAEGRPIVYAQGTTLHVGDRAIDTGLTPSSFSRPDTMTLLFATDDGAVFTNGEGMVWFSDGKTMDQIAGVPGKDQSVTGAVVDNCSNCFRSGVLVSEVGSTVVWMEFAGPDLRELVVYDTAEREVVQRLPLPVPTPGYAFMEDFWGDHVYWMSYAGRSGGKGKQLMVTTLSTGTHEAATEQALAAERDSRARLVVGRGAEAEFVTSRDEQGLQVRGSTLEFVRFDHDIRNANYFLPGFDAATGERLVFSAPPGIAKTDELVIFDWLDTDQFLLSNKPLWLEQERRRDIFTCRVSTETCQITVRKKPGPWLALPGAGMPG